MREREVRRSELKREMRDGERGGRRTTGKCLRYIEEEVKGETQVNGKKREKKRFKIERMTSGKQVRVLRRGFGGKVKELECRRRLARGGRMPSSY